MIFNSCSYLIIMNERSILRMKIKQVREKLDRIVRNTTVYFKDLEIRFVVFLKRLLMFVRNRRLTVYHGWLVKLWKESRGFQQILFIVGGSRISQLSKPKWLYSKHQTQAARGLNSEY